LVQNGRKRPQLLVAIDVPEMLLRVQPAGKPPSAEHTTEQPQVPLSGSRVFRSLNFDSNSSRFLQPRSVPLSHGKGGRVSRLDG
jgi:hypothetical protein